MIDFEDNSLEKLNVQMCRRQIQSDLLLRPPVWLLWLHVTQQCDCNDKRSQKLLKKRWMPWKGPLHTAQLILGLKLKLRWHWSISHLFLRTPGLENFTAESSWGGIKRMLSAAEGRNYREVGWGWICSSGAEQLAIVDALLSSVPNWHVKQPTNPTVRLLTALVRRWSLREQLCGWRVALHHKTVESLLNNISMTAFIRTGTYPDVFT